MPRRSVINVERFVHLDKRPLYRGEKFSMEAWKTSWQSDVFKWTRRKAFSGRRYLDSRVNGIIEWLSGLYERLNEANREPNHIKREKKFREVEKADITQSVKFARELLDYQIKKGKAHSIPQAIRVLEADLQVVQARAEEIVRQVGLKTSKSYEKYGKARHDSILFHEGIQTLWQFLRKGIEEIKKEQGIKT